MLHHFDADVDNGIHSPKSTNLVQNGITAACGINGMRLEWFRMYTEARTDEKLESLSDPEHRVWFRLLCLAAEAREERGSVRADNRRLLAVRASHGDVALLEATISALVDLDILADEDGWLRFVHFEERQYDKPSDRPEAVATRVREHRARVKAAPSLEVDPEKRAVTRSNAIEQSRSRADGDPDLEIKQAESPIVSAAQPIAGADARLPAALRTEWEWWYQDALGRPPGPRDWEWLGTIYLEHHNPPLSGAELKPLLQAAKGKRRPASIVCLELRERSQNGATP